MAGGIPPPPLSNLVEVLQCLEEALLLNHKLVEPLLVGLLSLATTGLGVWRQVRQKVAEGRRGRGRLCVEMSPCFSIGILHSSQWHLVVNGRCYCMCILSCYRGWHWTGSFSAALQSIPNYTSYNCWWGGCSWLLQRWLTPRTSTSFPPLS